MLAAISALLGVAEQFLGLEKVKELKEYVSKLVDTEQAIQAEMKNWPDVDSAKLESLWADKDTYNDAIAKQAQLLSATHPSA